MFVSLFLSAVLLTLARAQDCPPVEHAKNFDLKRYAQGTWYEIARYTNTLENSGNCVITNYTKRGDNDFVIEVSEVQNGKLIVYDGLLDLSTDDHLKGIVNYVFLSGKSNYKIPISFLGVDYNNYAIKYACMTDPKTKAKTELAWVLSRTKQLSPTTKATVDGIIASSKVLDKTRFFWDDFGDSSCKATGSSIDRTLPKRMIYGASAAECPKVDLLKNVDLSKCAQGAWYEIARYNNSVERYGNCIVTNYTRTDDGYVIEVTEIQDGRKIVYDGFVDVSTDEHRKGNITYMFLDNNITYRYSMIFLSVDYDSYALKYSCQIDPNTKSPLVFAWIYSKTPQLTASAKAAIDSYLATSKLLDKSKFYWDAFSDDACRFNTTTRIKN